MRNFNIYGCGGAGINNLNHYMENGRLAQFIAGVIGIDFSTANPAKEGVYDVVRHENTEGSGSNKATNIDKAPDLVQRALAALPPAKINIILASAAGGSGSVISTYLTRSLLDRGEIVLPVIIGDTTSIKELNNTVGTLRSLAAQSELANAPVVFCYRYNNHQNTQGAVNAEITKVVDSAITMLNLNNERIDYADIRNLFYFNKVVDAQPLLTQLSFVDDNNLAEYKRKPLAALSLFPDIDKITSPFETLLYRKAGIFGDDFRGYTIGLHGILDHGSTIKEVEAMLDDQQKKQSTLAGQYRTESKLTAGGTADGQFL